MALHLLPLRAWRGLRDRLGLRPSFERWLKARTCSDVTTGETVVTLQADYALYMRRRGCKPSGDFRSRFEALGHPVITCISGRVIVGRIRLKHAAPRARRATGPADAPLLIGSFAVPGDRR